MSNKLLIIWSILITLLLSLILILGYNYKKQEDYILLKNNIKESVKTYIKKEKINLPTNITTEELITKGYIKELKLKEKECNATIYVDKKYIFYKYDINIECIS